MSTETHISAIPCNRFDVLNWITYFLQATDIFHLFYLLCSCCMSVTKLDLSCSSKQHTVWTNWLIY